LNAPVNKEAMEVTIRVRMKRWAWLGRTTRTWCIQVIYTVRNCTGWPTNVAMKQY